MGKPVKLDDAMRETLREIETRATEAEKEDKD